MSFRKVVRIIPAFIAGICLVALLGESSAQTVGYWRFESGAFLDDSSGNSRNLTNLDNLATQVPISANFLNPIPPTGSGLTNAMAADSIAIGLLSAADDDAFTSGAFTVEALFRPDTLGGSSTNMLVGHWNSQSENPLDRGWFMGTSSGGIRFLIEGDDGIGGFGALGTNKFTGSIVPGNEYYTAVSFSVEAGGANPVVTTYLQDLTGGGPLQRSIQTFGSSNAWDLPNNSTAPLSIGSTATETASFDGLIDEVRYSNGALAVEDLLAYFPGITIEDEVILNPGVSISMTLADASVNGAIQSVTVSMTDPTSSTTYAPTDMVGATLTQFGGRAGAGDAQFILSPGTTAAPAAPDRAGVLGDNLADTGFINMDSWAVTFDQDIVNRPGPDIILTDWGGPDTIDITIGAETLDNVNPTSEEVAEALSDRKRFNSEQSPVDTLALLVDAATTFSDNGLLTAPGLNVYGIDLSNLGFGEGASLTSGTEVVFSGGTTIDPMEIFGLLEPAGLDGDFDNDNDVDGADFLAWQRGLGTIYDSDDLVDWETNYGMVLASTSAVAAVPEPSSMFLMIVAAGVAVFRRRSVV